MRHVNAMLHVMGFCLKWDGRWHADFRFFDPTLLPREWREWKI